MPTPIPIIVTQTINAKQGVPVAYSLSGTNISNTTKFRVSHTTLPITRNQEKITGLNPRLIFTPLVYGSGTTIASNGQFIPYQIFVRAWNSTEVDRFGNPLDQAEGTIYVNALPQKPVITAGQVVKAVDGKPLFGYRIEGKNVSQGFYYLSESPPSATQWTGTTLPSGLFLTQGGYITGTPTQIGSFTPTFRASNPSGTSAPVQISISVLPQAPKIELNGFVYEESPFFKPNIQILATQNQSTWSWRSSLVPDVSGPVSSLQLKSVSKVPVTWTATNLPKGVVLSKSGLLSGKPTVYPKNGRITSIATVKNSGGSLSINIYFTILPAPVITSTVFTIDEEKPFNFKILATNSPTSYSATLILNGVERPLPTWAVINKNTGTFTGTPPLLSSGVYIFRVTVTNSKGTKSSKNISVTVRPVELSLGAGTFTGAINVTGRVEIVVNGYYASGLNGKLDTNTTTNFSPNRGTYSVFILGRGYTILGNQVTKCPPGISQILHPGKMIYHAYKNTFGTSYNPSQRNGILISPGKTFRQLGFSEGIYNIIGTWVPSRCARLAGWKVTYSYPISLTLVN
jgi:hypothetical protein